MQKSVDMQMRKKGNEKEPRSADRARDDSATGIDNGASGCYTWDRVIRVPLSSCWYKGRLP